jgi:DUF4097 and DUF4098 domain-containing protein YvlB
MRPRSLAGPLVVILIGGLFLANNLWPELSIRHLLTIYWPFLLIAWGALRLIEVLVHAFASRQTPSQGISGGEWLLVVLICLIGSGGFWASRHAHIFKFESLPKVAEALGQPFDYPISGQKTVGKKPHIVIENLRGTTHIAAVDSDEMKIDGRKTVRSFLQSDADQADKQTPLQFTVDGDQVFLNTNVEKVTGDQMVRADLELTVPRGADIQAHGRSGDFDIAGISGNVTITSDNAGVRLKDIGGDVRVTTRKSESVRVDGVKGLVELHGKGGDVDVENIAGPVTVEGAYTGDQKYAKLAKPLRVQSPGTQLQVESVPGEITMDLSELTGVKLTGPIHLEARAKDVRLEDFSQSANLSIEKGDISLRPGRLPLAKIDAHTHSGDLQIALPQTASFDLTATTARGEIQNQFGTPLKATTEGHGAKLRGATGAGPAITLDTARGSITVERGELKLKSTVVSGDGPPEKSVTIETPEGAIKVQKE